MVEAMEIGSSSSALTPDYDVFLSFRASDPCQGFVNVLRNFLTNAELSVFRNDELIAGESAVDYLTDGILNSKVCIPIFSRGYASSRMCLRELTSMVELKKKIVPVFYDVEPGVVRLNTGPYVNDLRNHVEKKSKVSEVSRWEEALRYVSNLSGYVPRDSGVTQFCRSIVKEIVNDLKVKVKPTAVSDYLVGMEDQVEKVLKLLDVETPDVRYVGIHGMGGIGKTTLAKVVFNKLYDQFDSCCFLDAARDKSLNPRDLLPLQKQLLNDLQRKSGFDYISDIDEGIMQILRYKKVLIVLDGVDRVEQIEALAGNYSWFHSGSRIIITTRNKAVLPVAVCCYEVKPLDDSQALQLFNMFAFRNQSPPLDYLTLSRKVVYVAKSQPLLLKIIGSQLYNRPREDWHNTITKLKTTPGMDLNDKLKISWEALDFQLKHIFLEIDEWWDGWSQIKIGSSLKVLNLTGCKHLKTTPNLSELKSLERLILNGCSGLTEIDSSIGMLKRLKHLDLKGCTSLQSLPYTLSHLDALEEIFMEGSSERPFTLPEFIGHLKALKILEISYVWLAELPPSIGNLEKLEELALIGCEGFKLPYSLGHLKSLMRLDISHCEEIDELPDSIGNLEELKVLIIRETGITQLPRSIGKLAKLEELDAAKSKLKGALQVEMEHLFSLRSLNLSYTLIEVVPSLSKLSHLQTLYLGLCDMLVELPDLPTSLINLEVTSKSVQEIPDISKLNCLEELIWHCPKPDLSPQFPSSLSRLLLGELNLKQNVPRISHLRNLHHLRLVNCSLDEDFDRLGVGALKSLRTFEIVNCDLRELRCYCLPDDLERLCLKQCGSLKELHDLSHLKKMKQLEIDSCKSLSRILGLEELKNFQQVNMINCPSLVKVTDRMVEPSYSVERSGIWLDQKSKSHPVGMRNQVEAVKELLDVGAGDVLFVGIHGVGGIGKTTVARLVFNQLSPLFQGCSFLMDIQETSKRKGLKHLRNQLLREIPDFDNDKQTKTMKERFLNKKVLIVLDDVDQSRQIDKLVGKSSWFGSGSRIIVTTQDINVMAIEEKRLYECILKWPKEVRKYEMRELNDEEALQLFCSHAFGNDSPTYGDQTTYQSIVKGLGKLPLAIEIVGSFLNQRPEKWRADILKKLIDETHYGFQEKLKLCYEELEDNRKQIFLDVACYFSGNERALPNYMWDACGFLPDQGIDALVGMCWIKIIDGKFWMHDQVRKLGMEIVHRESSIVPTICSRLWGHEEVLDILSEHKGERVEKEKVKVKALSLCCDQFICEHTFTQKEFGSLPNLRFLELYGVHFSGDFKHSLSELRWLSWHFCPSDFGATNLHLESLVILDLSKSIIGDEWGGWRQLRVAKHLKVLNLTGCEHLKRTPDLSGYEVLERLILEDCENLVEIHNSIGKLKQLKYLNLKGCNSLKKLPDEVCSLKDLNEIVLRGDGKSFCLPKLIGSLTGLLVLEIANVHITEFPPSIGELKRLQQLRLSACSGMKELPDSLGGLSSLIMLDLSWTEFTRLPNSIKNLKELKVMRLDASSIRRLPSCIGELDNLEELYARSCRNLQGRIPVEIGKLSKLRILDLSFTRISSLPTTISQLCCLETIHLECCYEFYNLPPVPPSLVCLRVKSHMLQRLPDLVLSQLSSLSDLQLSYASSSRVLMIILPTSVVEWINSVFAIDVPWFPPNISRLFLSHLEVVNKLLQSLSNLEKLTFLELYSCIIKEEGGNSLGIGDHLEFVEHLSAHKCVLSRLDGSVLPKKLRVLCISRCKLLYEVCDLSGLENLLHLEITGCKNLKAIHGIGQLESLEEVIIGDCSSLVKLDDLSKLKRLASLQISRCENLIQLEGLNELESLKHFEVSRCKSLESLVGKTQFQRQRQHLWTIGIFFFLFISLLFCNYMGVSLCGALIRSGV